jgi:hypothetical protein
MGVPLLKIVRGRCLKGPEEQAEVVKMLFWLNLRSCRCWSYGSVAERTDLISAGTS